MPPARTCLLSILGVLSLLSLDLPVHADEVPPALDDSTVVTIVRGACPGMCPEYTLTLYGSGRVEFDGRRYVCARGRQTAQVDSFAVRNLVARLVDGGYFELAWSESPRVTGRETVTTSLTFAGRTRVVTHNHGDARAPRHLKAWEQQIDDAARSARWLPERKRDRPVCRREDGTVEIPGH